MGEFVDLKAMPYYLSDVDVAWVEQTIAGMSDEEKIGQLFISHNRGLDVDEAQEQISRYHYGGQRYKDAGSAARDVFDFTTGLREVAKIPMLVAASYGVAYHAKPKARAAANGAIDRGDLTDVLRLLGLAEGEWV